MSITRCGLCGTYHDDFAEAFECCSSRFEDDSDGNSGAAAVAMTDGGTTARSLDVYVRQKDTLAGVGDQELPCLDDHEWCPGPDGHQPGDTLPCAACFFEGGGD